MKITGDRLMEVREDYSESDVVSIASKYASAEYHGHDILVDTMFVGESSHGGKKFKKYRIIIYFIEDFFDV